VRLWRWLRNKSVRALARRADVVLIPTAKRIRTVWAGVVTLAIVLLPIIVLTSGRALRYALFGSSTTIPLPQADPWFSGLHGVPLVIIARLPRLRSRRRSRGGAASPRLRE